MVQAKVLSYDNPKLAAEFAFPSFDLQADKDLPIPGMNLKFGWIPSIRARMEYALATGEWDIKAGGGPKFTTQPAETPSSRMAACLPYFSPSRARVWWLW